MNQYGKSINDMTIKAQKEIHLLIDIGKNGGSMRLVRVPLRMVHRKAGIGDRSMLSIGGVRARISSILRRRGVVKGWRGEVSGKGLLSQDAILRVWMVNVEGVRSMLIVAWIRGSLRARLHPLFNVSVQLHPHLGVQQPIVVRDHCPSHSRHPDWH